jgi:phosphoadenosine phosphosulfate reductase
MVLVDLSDGSLLNEAVAPSLELAPDSGDSALAAASRVNGPVAIRFPSFGDGRGMSLARLLRERHGFQGEIRAVGYLIPDLALFLFRSGFDTAEIADPASHQSWKVSIAKIKHAYQPAARNQLPLRRDASAMAAKDLAERLAAARDLAERIAIVTRSVSGRIAFSTSLGLEDQAILNAIAAAEPEFAEGTEIDIFTLDTGRLFPEVLQTLELSEIRYGLRIRTVVPDAQEVESLVARDGIYGFRNAVENRVSCCEVRKVRPLNKALRGAGAWITGIRRAQSGDRAATPLAEWDAAHALIKVNPLADWSDEALEAYLAEHGVPVNPLHAQGFASIGCQPCTRAIRPGEDSRAGRWWWENEEKKECGLHLGPQRAAAQKSGQAAERQAQEGQAA